MAQIVKLRRSSVSGQKPDNSNLQLGELALNTTDGKVYMAVSGSLGPSVEELITTNGKNTGSITLSGSFHLDGIFAVTGAISASSFSGSASGLYNVPFRISGSDILGNTTDKTYTKLQFDDSTGLNVEETDPGTAFISIGSHFKDIFVEGQTLLSATGSDAFEIIPEGGIEISTSIVDTNSNGYIKELKISTTTLSGSLNSRIDAITGSIGGINAIYIADEGTIQGTASYFNFIGSGVSASVNNGTASINISGGGGNSGLSDGGYAYLDVNIAASSWTFEHNLGQRYPIFQIFDLNGSVLIPGSIDTIDSSTAQINFSSPQTGKAIASLGVGPGGLTQYFDASTTWTLVHNLNADYPIVTVWDDNKNIIFPNKIESLNSNTIKVTFSAPVSGHLNVAKGGHIVSGSISAVNVDFVGTHLISSSTQISGLGYAITGSNTFKGNQVVSGSVVIRNAKMDATCLTLSSSATVFYLYDYDGAIFDYVVKSGSNMRAGTITGVWDSSVSSYNETSTTDLGDTSSVTFDVTGTGQLDAIIDSGTWVIEVLYRALGCSGDISPTPTPEPTPTPNNTPTPTPNNTPTPTPTPSPTPFGYSIGDSFGGGVLYYILQPGDPGYVSGETHGLIAANTDITPVPSAGWGCKGTVIAGADGTNIGTGNANTIAIITDCNTSDTAARRCYNLTDGGYSDWYLPSLDELFQLYLSKDALLPTVGYLSAGYWSSSEYNNNANYAWAMTFSNGSQQFNIKDATTPVRAIRSF